VAYDGTGFCGFQLQGGGRNRNRPGRGVHDSDESGPPQTSKNNNTKRQQRAPQRTVQGELEQVLSRRFRRLVKIVGAGRTDAGVHARGQAFHFDLYGNETGVLESTTESESSFLSSLERSMNTMLPSSDVVVWNLQRAPAARMVKSKIGHQAEPAWYAWNVMQDCDFKLYSYRICIGSAMDPIERYHRWQYDWGYQIDPQRLERILKMYEGKHDFVCFSGALEQQQRKTGVVKTTVRTIQSVELVRERGYSHEDEEVDDDESQYYRIDIRLDGALYKMVRNLVGTALDVCRGQIEEGHFLDMLQRPRELGYTRNDNLSKPAPPTGLTLERVFYPDSEKF
jgi:tRNA pseudouridine38-40 synthase